MEERRSAVFQIGFISAPSGLHLFPYTIPYHTIPCQFPKSYILLTLAIGGVPETAKPVEISTKTSKSHGKYTKAANCNTDAK